MPAGGPLLLIELSASRVTAADGSTPGRLGHAIVAHSRRYLCFPIAPRPAVAIASSIAMWISLGALTGALSVLYIPNAIPKGALSGNHYKRMGLTLTAHVIPPRIFSSRPLPRKVVSLC